MDCVCLAVQIRPFPKIPPPTSEDENNNETTVIQVEPASEFPQCKGTSICELCGAGGDCTNCPICQPSLQCSPEACATCIGAFNVPSIKVVDGIVLLSDATTDSDGKQILGHLDVSYTKVSPNSRIDTEQTSPKKINPNTEQYSVGTTKYEVDSLNDSLTITVPDASYTMAWSDQESQALAFTYANIISNEQYGNSSSLGCPLASGVRK